jgi:hypothetical protein
LPSTVKVAEGCYEVNDMGVSSMITVKFKFKSGVEDAVIVLTQDLHTITEKKHENLLELKCAS